MNGKRIKRKEPTGIQSKELWLQWRVLDLARAIGEFGNAFRMERVHALAIELAETSTEYFRIVREEDGKGREGRAVR